MKTIKFILLVGFIIVTRLFDYASTYRFTHDLARETNILVSYGGFKWSGMLFFLILILSYAIYSLGLSIFSSYNIYPSEKGLKYQDFLVHLYLGYPGKWTMLFYRPPNSFARLNIIFGTIIAYSLIWAGMVTTPMWLLIFNSPMYWYFHNPLLIYIIIVFGILVIALTRLRYLYHTYRRMGRQMDLEKV